MGACAEKGGGAEAARTRRVGPSSDAFPVHNVDPRVVAAALFYDGELVGASVDDRPARVAHQARTERKAAQRTVRNLRRRARAADAAVDAELAVVALPAREHGAHAGAGLVLVEQRLARQVRRRNLGGREVGRILALLAWPRVSRASKGENLDHLGVAPSQKR